MDPTIIFLMGPGLVLQDFFYVMEEEEREENAGRGCVILLAPSSRMLHR